MNMQHVLRVRNRKGKRLTFQVNYQTESGFLLQDNEGRTGFFEPKKQRIVFREKTGRFAKNFLTFA